MGTMLGTELPAADLGATGDNYLRVTSGEYFLRDATGWAKQGSFTPWNFAGGWAGLGTSVPAAKLNVDGGGLLVTRSTTYRLEAKGSFAAVVSGALFDASQDASRARSE